MTRPRPTLASLRRVTYAAGVVLTWLAAGAVHAASVNPNAPPSGAPTPVANPNTAPAAGLHLEVLLLNDADFPPVTQEQAQVILREARATLADKLGFNDVTFHLRGPMPVETFLQRQLAHAEACLTSFAPYQIFPGMHRAIDTPPAVVERFLSRWSVEALQAFFPPAQRAELTGYPVIGARLLEELDRKVQRIAGFTLKNGASLVAPESIDKRSYVRWICAMREQDEADLVLTNAFILYDLASEPYPHTVFQKCKVGGASLSSPKRRPIRGRAVVASTFSMVTDLPFFQEEGVGTLTAAEHLAVTGTFIVAHELGHAVFKLADFYDHPRQCLMTTKFETGYVSGYRDLKALPGACPMCEPYVAAKRFIFAADAARAAGRFGDAVNHLRDAIRATPKHIDGSYVHYMADLSVEIAELYALQENAEEANRWLGAALRLIPDHPDGVALRLKIGPVMGAKLPTNIENPNKSH